MTVAVTQTSAREIPGCAGPASYAEPMPTGGAHDRSGIRQGFLLVCLLGIFLAACSSTPGGTGSTRQQFNVSIQPKARPGEPYVPAGRAATLGPRALNPSKANGVQLDVLNGLRDDTPIFNGDFADPYVLKTSAALYLYASNTTTTQYAPAAHIPVIEMAQSSGFRGDYLGDALPQLPKWTVSGFQWAPSVWARPDGTYVMYYSTPATIPLECLAKASSAGCVRTAKGVSSAMCISRATSTSPAGPFVDDSSSAFICPVAQGGAIDPSVFIDQNGSPWLLWKSDGDCCGLATTIYSQQLTPDGLSVAGPPHPLIGASQPWEGGLVEGPSMLESYNNLWLFYSANKWGTDNYGIGIAHCVSVVGPCTKPLSDAWLSSSTSSGAGQRDPGPGGEEFFQVGGLVWMVHHGLAPGQSGDDAQRRLYVDLLAFTSGEQPPRIAQGDPAAALAEGVLYNEDPDLPSQPRAAYLLLLHKVGNSFSGVSNAAAVADGLLSCRELGQHQNAEAIVASLQNRGLTVFESYLVAMLSTKYFCPQDVPQGLVDIRQALVAGP